MTPLARVWLKCFIEKVRALNIGVKLGPIERGQSGIVFTSVKLMGVQLLRNHFDKNEHVLL